MTVSRADARQTLYDALTAGGVDARDRAAKPGDVVPPAVLVTLQGGVPREYFLFNVEVYVRASDPTIAAAQDTLDELVQRVDDALSGASLGPGGDNISYAQDLDAWVAIFPVEMPRTDDF